MPEVGGSVSEERIERIEIPLTQGGLNNNYVSLREYLYFFPEAAIGPANARRDGQGALLTLRFEGLLKPVETDIAGNHMIFRRRSPWGRFFAHHGLRAGDKVAIEKRSDYEYRIIPLP